MGEGRGVVRKVGDLLLVLLQDFCGLFLQIISGCLAKFKKFSHATLKK